MSEHVCAAAGLPGPGALSRLFMHKRVPCSRCAGAAGGAAPQDMGRFGLGYLTVFPFHMCETAKAADELKLELALLPHRGDASSVLINRLTRAWSLLQRWLL